MHYYFKPHKCFLIETNKAREPSPSHHLVYPIGVAHVQGVNEYANYKSSIPPNSAVYKRVANLLPCFLRHSVVVSCSFRHLLRK